MSRWKEQRELELKQQAEEEKAEKPTLEQIEGEFEEALDDIKKGFRQRMEKEKSRFANVCDTNYYFVVCFTNFEQLSEFCESIGQDPMLLYVDGKDFAKKINRALKTADYVPPQRQSSGKDYEARALDETSGVYPTINMETAKAAKAKRTSK